jgi:hypothetical protein
MNRIIKTAALAAIATISILGTAGAANATDAPTNPNPNLVKDGDFEWDGPLHEGTSTALRYVPRNVRGGWNMDWTDTMYAEGTYTLGDNAYDTHELWADNPFRSRMMIVNGFDSGDRKDAVVWSQTVSLDKPVETRTLWAGQNFDAGTIEIRPAAEGKVSVTYKLNQAAIDAGYSITQIHLQTADTLAGIPQTNGNPTPGKFAVNETYAPGTVQEKTFTVNDGDFVAAHAVISKTEVVNGVPVTKTDTAWAGEKTALFSGKNWALYSSYAFEVPTYEFSMDAMNVLAQTGVGADLTVLVNGKPVQAAVKLDGDAGAVVEVKGIVEYAPTATIEIRNASTLHHGNDFAMDNISLKMIGA